MARYRISDEHSLYFVTFSVVKWLPIFVAEDPCHIVTSSLSFCHREKHLRINAYVIMPTHMHAILFDEDFDAQRLRETLTALRKYTGRQLADYCVAHKPACFARAGMLCPGTARRSRRRSAAPVLAGRDAAQGHLHGGFLETESGLYA